MSAASPRIIDHVTMKSIYFTDRTALARIEGDTYWVNDPTGRPANYDDSTIMFDVEPVGAVDENRPKR